MKKLIKKDLAVMFMDAFNVESVKKSEVLVDEWVEMVAGALLQGKSVMFAKQRSLKLKFKQGGRLVRNVRTGEAFPMKDTVSLSFSKGSDGRERLLLLEQIEVLFGSKSGIKIDTLKELYLEMMEHTVEIRGLFTIKPKDNVRKVKNPKTGEVLDGVKFYNYSAKLSKSVEILPEQHHLYK